jgi:hypothetical protein
MKTLIALALSAALITPAMSGDRQLPTKCTVEVGSNTLSMRTLPNGKKVVSKLSTGDTVWILDTITVNGRKWIFGDSDSYGAVAYIGWIDAAYLTRCRHPAHDD